MKYLLARMKYVVFGLFLTVVSAIAWEFEPDLGLPVLYLLRGERAPPPGAMIVNLDRQSVDWLAFDAPDLKEMSPETRECLPESTREALVSIRNIEDIPRAVYGCLLNGFAPYKPAVVTLDVHFGRSDDAAGDEVLRSGLLAPPEVAVLSKVEQISPNGQFVLRRPAEALAGDVPTGFFAIEQRNGDTYRYLAAIEDFPTMKGLPELALSLARPGAESGATRSVNGVGYRNLNLYGHSGSIPHLSLRDLLEDPSLGASLTGSAVFIGASRPGGEEHRDSFETAFTSAKGGNVNGVELMATAYLNLKEGAVLQRLPAVFEIPLAIFVSALVFAVSLRGAGASGAILACSVAAAWLLTAHLAFGYRALWLPAVAPVLVSAPLAAGLAIFRGYLSAESLVGRLLPAPFRATATRGLSPGDKGGDIEEATVVFLDIADSTALAADLPPEDFAGAIARCMRILTEEVERAGGSVVKYTGDGLIAVFLAARLDGRHAAAAIRAIRRTARAMVAAGDAQPDAAFGRLVLRVGVDSGPVAFGFVGSASRGSVDIVGDPVNIAARLEQLGKNLYKDGSIVAVASTRTVECLGSEGGPITYIGLKELKGLRDPIGVFRVM